MFWQGLMLNYELGNQMKEYEDWKLQYGGGVWVKRELGIARCGLACCLCSENVVCNGCNSGECPDKEWCENRKR